VARTPSEVLSTSFRISPCICATSLLADFARMQLRNPIPFLTPDTYAGVLLRQSPEGSSLSTWAMGTLCHWARRSRARTRHRVPRERCAFDLLPSKLRVSKAVPVPLAVSLIVPFDLFGSEGEGGERPSGAHREVVVPMDLETG
jgi:hypothetical protein